MAETFSLIGIIDEYAQSRSVGGIVVQIQQP